MITQLQWIIGSAVIIYVAGVTWTYGYLHARRHTCTEEDFFTAVFFPFYYLGAWVLSPLAEMGNSYAMKRQEKKLRIEAHEKEMSEQLKIAEQELNEEFTSKAA